MTLDDFDEEWGEDIEEDLSEESIAQWLRESGLTKEADALDDTTFPANDPEEVEEDLNDALELIQLTYDWFCFVMDPDLCGPVMGKLDPTLISEGKKLMIRMGKFLNQWE